MTGNDDELPYSRLTLAFADPAAEEAWGRERLPAAILSLRLTAIISIALHLFAIAIWPSLTSRNVAMGRVLFAAMLPPQIVGLLLIARARRLVHHQLIAGTVNALLGVGNVLALALGGLFEHYAALVVIEVFLFAAIVLQLRFIVALAASLPYLVLFGVIAVSRGLAQRMTFDFVETYTAWSVAMFGVYLFERSSRQLYAQRRMIETLKAQLEVELRHQVRARSRGLAEAVHRLGGVTPRAQKIEVGEVIDERYRVVRQLGAGGMGAVYEVERVADRRRLAMKVLTNAVSGEALARLAREAEIAGTIAHEHLVSIVDVDVSASGALYVVMELVVGKSLSEASTRFGEVGWALTVLRQVAAGLAALHGAGIVHRDLKPSNVLLAGDEAAPQVKIADFGIARLSDARSVEATEPMAVAAAAQSPLPMPIDRDTVSLTRSDVIVGTPLYMAPELARGTKYADQASDVWSLGVLAYELFARQRPFATPPLFDAAAGKALLVLPRLAAPEPIAALVAAMLAVAPADRPTAEAIVTALDALIAAR